MIAEIQRAAAMRQPAHDDLVRPQHLLAVDAEVLPGLVRTARDHQPPGDERRDIARPTMLDRQLRQIHILAFPDDFLARRRRQHLGRHGQDLFEDRPFLPRIFQSFGRLRLLQVGQQLAHFAQCRRRLFAHAQRHAARRAEQVGENWYFILGHLVPDHVLEQQRRALRAQHAIADLGHLQMGGDRRGHALEFAEFLQLGDKVAQVVVFHLDILHIAV